MRIEAARNLSPIQKRQILALWNREYPAALNYETIGEFENYLAALSDANHILVVNDKGDIQGWYFDFIRDKEKWFAIILHSEIHGRGFGSQLLQMAKATHKELNGWVIDHNHDLKIDGTIYQSPLAFYLKDGFEQLSYSRLELDKISAVQIQWVKK